MLKKIAYFRSQQIIKKRPLDINIETINTCPLKCVFCCNRLYERKRTVMDNTLFEDILSQYSKMGGGGIGIGSMQSDFLSDPLLLDRIKIIEKYKKNLWVYSTTPLISCKKYSDKELLYILQMFDYLQISVEGHDQESYQNMAGVNGFDLLLEQLARITKIIDENALQIRIGIYCRTYNKGELQKSAFFRKLKKNYIIEDIKDTFFSWFGSIKQEDLPWRGAKLAIMYNEGKRINCVVPNVTLSVQATGKVVGCGCIDWLEKYIIGDARKDTLKEIWNSPKAIKFRNAFARGKLPSICKECALYSPIDECMKDTGLLFYKPQNGLYYLAKRK